MINKRQFLLGAGSVLAASTLPALAHKNADGVALKAIEHPKPFFEVLYLPLEKATRFCDTPCALYWELSNGNKAGTRTFFGRFNYIFNDDGTNQVGWKLNVDEKVSFAAQQLNTATEEQKEYVKKDYQVNGMTVAEMPEAMLRNHLRMLDEHGPMNAKDIEYWIEWEKNKDNVWGAK